MARPALKNVSTASLTAELARRAAHLGKLLKIRDQVDKDIADLKSIAGQFGATAAAAPVKLVRTYRRRKAKVVKAVAKAVAKVAKAVAKKGKRGVFKQTGEEMILHYLAQEPLTSGELAALWKDAGRGGTVANELTRLVKLGRIKRTKVKGVKGSRYSVGGGKAGVAKPVAKKPTAKLAAKKGKKTFTCPTCKAVFRSGPMLGVHYKAQPTHRVK